MFSNRLAFAALAVACIAAAAGGGYLATRQNTVPTPASAATTPTATTASAPAGERPVQETEAVVGDTAGPAPKVAAAATVTPSKARSDVDRSTDRARASQTARSTQSSARTPPPLDRTWPTSASAQPPLTLPPALPVPSPADQPPGPKPDDRSGQEPSKAPEPPQKTFTELVVPSQSVIGLQTETSLSSERAKVEDRVEAHLTRDVRVDGDVAIPAGTKVIGSVTQVERGGKFKERARLAVRFHTLVLADGTRLPMNTETIVREGSEPDAAKKVGGGAVGGAILGAILGGAKGAAIGAAAGAGGGAAVQMAGDRSAVTMPPGTPLTVRLVSPVTVTLEKE
jgi:hypothetical protein